MKDELFAELVASVREGGAILRGEAALARTFQVAGQILNKFAPITTCHRMNLRRC